MVCTYALPQPFVIWTSGGGCYWLTSVIPRHHVVSDIEAQLEVPGTVAQVYLVLQDVHAVVHVLVAAQKGERSLSWVMASSLVCQQVQLNRGWATDSTLSSSLSKAAALDQHAWRCQAECSQDMA